MFAKEGYTIQSGLAAGTEESHLLIKHAELLWLLAAVAGIAGVAYADFLVVSISLGYLYVLPLSLSALTQRLRVTLVLVGICVLLHDLLGPYEHSGWPILHRTLLTTAGFTTVAMFVWRLAEQRNKLIRIVRAQRDELALEMKYAAQVQQRLLPRKPPDIPPFDLAGMMAPAKQLGGDYYDYILLPKGNLGIVIADVSGKGAQAALFMPSVRVALRMETHSALGTDAVIGRLDQVLLELAEQTHYVTVFYAKLDVPSRKIQYTNAGHFPPFITRSGDEVVWLTEGGPPVGILPEVTYDTGSADLLPGDTLVLYTDGVIEAENNAGEQFSRERLVDLVRANPEKGAQELIKTIHSAVLAFTGTSELRDDFTLAVLRLPPVFQGDRKVIPPQR